jgi:hypothetical protein
MSYSALLADTLTYWSPSTSDGFGGMSYGAPTGLLGRYQLDNQNFQDADGEEFISASICYTTTQLVQDGWVYEGASVAVNPQTVEGAYRIRRLYTTASPNDSITVYKAVLG